MEKKSNLPLALAFYAVACIVVCAVVFGYFAPEKEVQTVETIKHPTLYRSGNGLWSPTRK